MTIDQLKSHPAYRMYADAFVAAAVKGDEWAPGAFLLLSGETQPTSITMAGNGRPQEKLTSCLQLFPTAYAGIIITGAWMGTRPRPSIDPKRKSAVLAIEFFAVNGRAVTAEPEVLWVEGLEGGAA
jgi:hypothetical protein